MARNYNLARMTTTTSGTGTITLGSAVSGHLSFAAAGVQNGELISYGIRDGANSEVGTGVYTSSGTTLTRNVTKSTNAGSAISLSGSAEVFIATRAEDLFTILATGTVAANATSLDFILSNYTEFHAIKFFFQHFLPASSAVFWIRLSTNAGSSYDAGATDYAWASHQFRSGNATNNTSSTGAAQIANGTDGVQQDGLDAELTLYDQTSALNPLIQLVGNHVRGTLTSDWLTFNTSGRRAVAQDTDAIRFMWASGNFSSGNAGRYAVVGVR